MARSKRNGLRKGDRVRALSERIPRWAPENHDAWLDEGVPVGSVGMVAKRHRDADGARWCLVRWDHDGSESPVDRYDLAWIGENPPIIEKL